jgi:hypothetical protein
MSCNGADIQTKEKGVQMDENQMNAVLEVPVS